MPGKIQPPGANAAQAYMIRLFMQTETDIIREITRKRGSGYVDYAEVAALERVQATLQKMVDDANVWTPKMIEHIFYHGKGTMAGYQNARSVAEPTPGRIRAIEQLSDNLMAMVTEMAGTAYQSAKEKVYSIGRLDPDQFAIEGMQSAAKAQAAGRGALTTISEFEKNLQEKGITAFVDKRGHEWSLRDYGNMAVRTTSRQAQVAAVLTEDEHDLYQISSIGSTCPLCAVYEGRVYSKSGTDPHYPPLTMAFGKIDPAGGDDLSNTFLNIHPNCLVPGGLVLAEGLVSESRRPYDGKVVTLETSSGNRITVTPNHPVLTDHGFIAAGLLEEGQKIIEAGGKYTGLFGEAPNDINIPTGLEEIFHSLVSSGGGTACSVEGSAEQFHGDGVPDSKVDIVFADGSGISKRDPVLSQKLTEKDLPAGHLRRPILLPKGSLTEIFIRALSSLYRRVSRFGLVCGIKGISEDGKNLSDLRRGAPAGLGDLSVRQPGFVKSKETVKKFSVLGPELFGNIVKALAPGPLGKDHAKVMLGVFDSQRVEIKFPGDVCASEPLLVARLQELLRDDGLVVSVLTHKSASSYSGFVYNLETKYGYYAYNNIVTHNCLHSLVKYTEKGKTEKQIQKMRDFSSFEKRPADVDPRTKKQREAYETKERNRARLRSEIKQFEKYTASGVEGMPKTFAAFQRHKQADDDKYKEWETAYRSQAQKKRRDDPAPPPAPAPAQQGPTPPPAQAPAPATPERMGSQTIEQANAKGTDVLRQAYEAHRVENGTRSVPLSELPDDSKILKADYGKMSPQSADAFNGALADLAKDFDTPLQEIRTMTKEEFIGKSKAFAFVSHNYDADSAVLVINPGKCKDLESMAKRIADLSDVGYIIKLADPEKAKEYVAIHEFAHTILNMADTLSDKHNWVGADYGKVRSARREIEKIFDRYMGEVGALTQKVKDLELQVIMETDLARAKELEKLYRAASAELAGKKLSDYSLANIDEFLAEAFTNERIGAESNPYGREVMQVLTKYFGRR